MAKKKVTKFVKKEIDEKDYVCCKLNGTWSNKEKKNFREYMNRAAKHFLNPPVVKEEVVVKEE